MNQLPRIGYNTDRKPRKFNGGKVAFYIVVGVVLVLLFKAVILDDATCAKASTRNDYFAYAPQVERGVATQLVDGVPVTTPTVEVK